MVTLNPLPVLMHWVRSSYRGFGTGLDKATWDAIRDLKSLLGAMMKESRGRVLSGLGGQSADQEVEPPTQNQARDIW